MAKRPKVADEDLHREAMRRADEAHLAESPNIQEGRDCQRFYAASNGGQWDETARKSREADGRPVLTINRLPQFTRQMTGDLRKSPPELKFLPAKEGASQDAAEALNGIKRNIDAQSNGKDCYIIATENAAIASQGAWRILTEYTDDKSFDQEIRKRPIRDPFGFLIDPWAIEPDKSDMSYAFIFENISVKEFEAKYPGFSATDMPFSDVAGFPWRKGDSVRIAEYWVRNKVKSKLYQLPDGSNVTELPPGVKAVRERDVEMVEVCSYMMTGKDILSGPHEWAGIYIPLCVVVGEEITIDGNTIRKGMVHDARDPQRIYNYSRSAGVEAVALQPKAPFIGTVAHFAGRPEWKTAAAKNHAFLAFNPDPQYPNLQPQRSQPAIASQGMDTQAVIAAGDMEAVTGIYRASLGAPSNETSGIAIARKQHEGDTGTYLYPDNLARAIGYEGKILADLIPRIINGDRTVRILKEDGTADMLRVNSLSTETETDEKTGKPKPQKPMIDLTAGKFDVVVTTGPSFATRRQEAAAGMTELVRAVPAIGQIAGDLVVKNMDFPGADEIAKRLERMLPPGVKDDGPQQQPAPDPQAVAGAMKDAATADKTKAETDQIQVETATMLVQLQATIQQIHAMLAGGGPPPGQPPGGAPAGPAGPPMGHLQQQPAQSPPQQPQPQPNGADNGPPMVELDSIGAPA